jgi:hypothetical protein
MSAELQSIKIAYEVENLTPEEIAEDRGLELSAVKAALCQVSVQYRRECRQEDDDSNGGLDFSKDQLREVTQAMFNLAMGAEDESVRARLLLNIRDDAKGRKEIKKGVQEGGFNILIFNEAIKKMREGLKDESPNLKAIEV